MAASLDQKVLGFMDLVMPGLPMALIFAISKRLAAGGHGLHRFLGRYIDDLCPYVQILCCQDVVRCTVDAWVPACLGGGGL